MTWPPSRHWVCFTLLRASLQSVCFCRVCLTVGCIQWVFQILCLLWMFCLLHFLQLFRSFPCGPGFLSSTLRAGSVSARSSGGHIRPLPSCPRCSQLPLSLHPAPWSSSPALPCLFPDPSETTSHGPARGPQWVRSLRASVALYSSGVTASHGPGGWGGSRGGGLRDHAWSVPHSSPCL